MHVTMEPGKLPGEIGSTNLETVLRTGMSDFVLELGWKDPPEVTAEAMFEVAQWLVLHHGYRLQPDETRDRRIDRKVGCKCGSTEMPCPEFERYRLLMTAAGLGEGHSIIGINAAYAQVAALQHEVARMRMLLGWTAKAAPDVEETPAL